MSESAVRQCYFACDNDSIAYKADVVIIVSSMFGQADLDPATEDGAASAVLDEAYQFTDKILYAKEID